MLFWLASRRGLLRDVAAEKFTEGTSVPTEEKVRTLVLERLWMNESIQEQWQGVRLPFLLLFSDGFYMSLLIVN